MLKDVAKFEVYGIPVGSAALLLAALGLTQSAIALLERVFGGRVPAFLTGAVLAIGAETKFVKKGLGSTVADILAIASLANGFDNSLNIRGNVQGFVDSLLSRVTGLIPGVGDTTDQIQGFSGIDMGALPAPATTQYSDMERMMLQNRGLA